MAAVISIDSVVYGATVTTMLTSTQTATVGQYIYLTIPTPLSPPPTLYTSVPAPTAPNQKEYPNGLPILVLTQLDNVIIDPSGSIIETATIVQGLPPVGPTLPAGQKLYLVPPGNGWTSWTAGEKAGVIIAAMLVGLGLFAAWIWICIVHRGRKKAEKEMNRRRRSRSGNKTLAGFEVRDWVHNLFGQKKRSGTQEAQHDSSRRNSVREVPGTRTVISTPSVMPRYSQGPNDRRRDEMSGALPVNEPSQQVSRGEMPLRPPVPTSRYNDQEYAGGGGRASVGPYIGRGFQNGAVRADGSRVEPNDGGTIRTEAQRVDRGSIRPVDERTVHTEALRADNGRTEYEDDNRAPNTRREVSDFCMLGSRPRENRTWKGTTLHSPFELAVTMSIVVLRISSDNFLLLAVTISELR